jgi:protein SCO1/2
MKNWRVFYVAASLVVLFAVAALYEYTKPASYHGALIDPPKAMPDFTLQSVNGPVKLSDFRGKYVALYFGYTSCPDICPTTLAGLKAAISKLDNRAASQVQVIFVSVDYKRDTPEKVAGYVQNFHPDFVGLTGSQAEIDLAAQEFGIYYKLNTPDPATGYYSVDHTAIVLVLDRQGNLVLTWDYGQQPDEIASDLGNLLKK